MQALKALVIVLGVMIVGALGLLGYGLVTRLGGDGDAPPAITATVPGAAAPESAAAGTPAPFGDVTLAGYPGCIVRDAVPDGRRVWLLLGPAPGSDAACAAVILFDSVSGEAAGSVTLAP